MPTIIFGVLILALALWVLGVISRQPDELSPVFDMILDNALKLCDASVGDMFRIEDGLVRVVGMRGALPEYAEFRRNQRPYAPPPDTPLGVAIQQREPVQIRDMRELPGLLDDRRRSVLQRLAL